MLIYLNSEQELPIGAKIEVPNMMVLFQKLTTATTEAHLEKKKDNKCYTYAAIIDDPIHDPFVQRQIDAVYVPNDLGLYPDDKGGLIYDDFVKAITNIKSSLSTFVESERLLNQIRNIGFSGGWIFDNNNSKIVTLKKIDALIIKSIKGWA